MPFNQLQYIFATICPGTGGLPHLLTVENLRSKFIVHLRATARRASAVHRDRLQKLEQVPNYGSIAQPWLRTPSAISEGISPMVPASPPATTARPQRNRGCPCLVPRTSPIPRATPTGMPRQTR